MSRRLIPAPRAQSTASRVRAAAFPYIAAERGFVDAVIEPSATRREIAKALRILRGKRETLPPRKHGNIPL